MNVNNFIMDTDYATLKNDDIGTVTLKLGATGALALNAQYIYESSAFVIGTINAGLRTQIYTSATPNDIWSGNVLTVTLTATVSTTPATVFDFSGTVYLERVSATQVKLKCVVYGLAAGYTTVITGNNQVVTANVATFLSPFN